MSALDRVINALFPPRKEPPVQSRYLIEDETDNFNAVNKRATAESGALNAVVQLTVDIATFDLKVNIAINQQKVALETQRLAIEEQKLRNAIRAEHVEIMQAIKKLSNVPPNTLSAAFADYNAAQKG